MEIDVRVVVEVGMTAMTQGIGIPAIRWVEVEVGDIVTEATQMTGEVEGVDRVMITEEVEEGTILLEEGTTLPEEADMEEDLMATEVVAAAEGVLAITIKLQEEVEDIPRLLGDTSEEVD